MFVLDDLYEECVNAKAIDYSFRVLSGKKKLSVIITSQRYFAKGKFALNIRNNCNFTVLMRNTDSRVNQIVSRSFNVHKQVMKCLHRDIAHPHALIDTTPSAMFSGFNVFDNVFEDFLRVHTNDDISGIVIPEDKFMKEFEIYNQTYAKVKDSERSKGPKRKR